MSSVKGTKRDDKSIVVSFDSDSEESSSSEESADEAPRQQPSKPQPPVADKPAAAATNNKSAPVAPASEKSQTIRPPAGSSSESDDDNDSSTTSAQQQQKQQPSPAAATSQKPAAADTAPAATARRSTVEKSDQSSSDEESDAPAAKTNHQKPSNSVAAPVVETPPAPVPTATKPASSDDAKPAKTVKKKAPSSKTESVAVNGTDQSSAAAADQVKEVKPQTIESPGEPAAPAKKKVVKKKTPKSAESVENGISDEPATKAKEKENSQQQIVEKTTEIINTKPETDDVKPVPAETAPAATTTKKKVVKKPKASAASATTNGNVEKVNSAEDTIDKILDGKETKKPTELDTKVNSSLEDSTAKPEVVATPPEALIPTKQEEKVSTEAEVKEKPKKKRDSVSDASGEAAKVEEGANKATDVADGATAPTTKKVVKKRPKKVASADSALPAEDSGVAATPAPPPAEPCPANTQINQQDIEADREVMMICDVKTDDVKNTEEINKSEPAVTAVPVASTNVEDIANVLEVSLSQQPDPEVPLSLQPDNSQNLDNEKLVNGTTNDTESAPVTDALGAKSSLGSTTLADDSHVTAVPSTDDNIKSESDDRTTKSLENEENDYSFRRKSMDDFIKRILAEAREEQQKRLPSLTTTAADDTSSGQTTTKVSDGSATDAAADDDIQSMLDRRLASTDRKRLQTDTGDLGLTENGLGTSTKKSGVLADLDIDDDLADIKGYFSKRNLSSKLDSTGLDFDDETNLRPRTSTRLDPTGTDDGLSISQKILKDVLSEDTSSYLTRIRQQHQSGTETLLGEDSFAPRRREETSDLVRSSSRPVKALIDQQADVIQQFKATTRNIDDLETEIRSLRETFLDRQARIDSLRNAIDAETRVYEAEQNATNERIKQQRIPGGNFVREEFMASMNIGTASSRLHAASAAGSSLDLGFRSRSGSVTSASGLDFSMLSSTRATSLRPSAVDIGLRRQSAATDVDDSTSLSAYSTTGYTPSRIRRGGSVARERTYNIEDLLGGGGSGGTTSDNAGTTWTSRTTTTTTSSGLPSFDVSSSSSSYEPSRYQYDTSTSDYNYRTPSSYSTRSSLYSGSSTLQSREPGRYSSSRYTNSSDLSGGSGGLDTSRFRRAQSVFDVSTPSYDTSSATSSGGYSFVSTRYSGGASGDSTSGRSGGEFQSKFLDKVRGNRSGASDDSSRSDSSGFKSRFLRSNYDSSSSKRY